MHPKSNQNLSSLFNGSWRPTWPPKASQKPPKIEPTSKKIDQKSIAKIDQNFACILSGSWAQHGPKMVPKAPPKGGGLLLPCWALEASWGALGASCGPRANFIDFWSIFERFLTIFGRILVICLMIFDRFLSIFWIDMLENL